MRSEKPILAFIAFAAFSWALVLGAPDPLCAGLPSGEVVPFPHETNCSLYYECLNGDKTVLTCPSGFYYNEKTESCDFEDVSGCTNRVDPLCAGAPQDEIVAFPHDSNCSLYYECLNGVKTLLICGDGLFFNPSTESCDFPEASGCKNPETCDGIDLDYRPHPDGDCSKYLECYKGDSYEMNCPPGFWFDSKSKMCVLPADSDCGGTTSPPWTTPHPLCWGVRPGQTKLVRYEGDCRKYWRCTGSELTLETCPPPLFFDEARQACDFPSVVDCDQSTGTPDDSSTTPGTTPGGGTDPRCTGTGISYWPDEDDCRYYVECYGDSSYIMSCPAGLYFSDRLKECVDPSQSECGSTTRTTGTLPTNYTPDPDCPYPEAEGDLFPFPGDCTKFYECAEGRKVEMNCPNGLFFNPTILECDYPYQAGCAWAKRSFLKMLYSFFLG